MTCSVPVPRRRSGGTAASSLQREPGTGRVVRVERFVSPDGSPDNAGTVDSPWSLTKGLTEMSEGDVLFLRGGSYSGNFTIKGRHGNRRPPDRGPLLPR